MNLKNLVLLMIGIGFVSCSSETNFKASLEKTLEENPEIVTELVKKHPAKFMDAFKFAAMESRKNEQANREINERKQIENFVNNPLPMNIRADETIRGAKDGKIRIIEYSDFQCPFCSRGADTMMELIKKYDGEIAFVYKHLPIDSIHPQARLASKYYEAVRVLDEKKAFKFHDRLLKEQQKIRMGKSYLDKVVKDLGLDLKKVKKIAESKAVSERIKEDEKEAQKFGFSGTPGFLVEGVPVKGAYPLEYFVKVIEKIKAKKNL